LFGEKERRKQQEHQEEQSEGFDDDFKANKFEVVEQSIFPIKMNKTKNTGL